MEESKKCEGEGKKEKKKTVQDFKFGPKIGVGAYSQVVVAEERGTGKLFAVKMILKEQIVKQKKQEYAFRERDILGQLRGHPFVVKIYYTFQDSRYLYYVISYARRGEMLRYINALKGFDKETTRFYSSEIISALEYLHSKDIIHRDLKPENILVNEDYHIMVTDFGTARNLNSSSSATTPKSSPDSGRSRSSSFVGTAQYVSPELLDKKYICKSSDLWSLGVIIYQMVTSKWPFNAPTEYLIFEKIKKRDFTFPPEIYGSCQDLINQLLATEPSMRLGDENEGGFTSLKSHSFFDGVPWDDLLSMPPSKQMRNSTLKLLPSVVELAGENESDFGLFPGPSENSREIMTHGNQDPSQSCSQDVVLSQGNEDLPETTILCDIWNEYVGHNKIVKYGVVLKRKTRIHRQLRRILLASEGPRLVYVDPQCNKWKGEVPWGSDLQTYAVNFRSFEVKTKHRTYYLEDVDDHAESWVDIIRLLHSRYFSGLI